MTKSKVELTQRKLPFFAQALFEGALCREEVVSACLAMLLEGSTRFRKHFFRQIGDEQVAGFFGKKWKIEVEYNEVDISLTHHGVPVYRQIISQDLINSQDWPTWI